MLTKTNELVDKILLVALKFFFKLVILKRLSLFLEILKATVIKPPNSSYKNSERVALSIS